MLMEQLHYNFLFRWFVGLDLDETVWDATVITPPRAVARCVGIAILVGELMMGQQTVYPFLFPSSKQSSRAPKR